MYDEIKLKKKVGVKSQYFSLYVKTMNLLIGQ
jgi:hypothetical protein